MALDKKCLPPRLRYVSDQDPGIRRKKWGRGFSYFNPDGKRISDPKVRSRIEELTIPPIWSEVWICAKESGHLQATGLDLKGRKQYIYHAEWITYRQDFKYTRLTEFGKVLPKIRHQAEEDLKRPTWDKEKVLALTVRLMDEHYLRVGNKYYTRENESYGLTTLRRKHLKRNGRQLHLSYRAKSGKIREINIEDRDIKRMIMATSELPGYEIFRYLDEHGKSRPLLSEDVNDYLKSISGYDFTAKDFRTWGGTVLSVELIGEAREKLAENPRLQLDATLIGLVAEKLGNTPATCREYYVHPRVLEKVLEGNVKMRKASKGWTAEERTVMKILGQA